MSIFLRKAIAVPSLLFLLGCAVNPEANSTTQGVSEVACADSTKTFDSSGAAEPLVLLSALPVGHYAHASSEIYVENQPHDGSAGTTQVQFLETPANPSGTAFSTGLRCNESTGTFRAYTENPVLITDFSVVTKGVTFDYSQQSYSLNFSDPKSPSLQVSLGSDQRGATLNTVLATIGNYWNASYRFVRRAGSTYEFYGIRTESDTGRTIYGKAVFTLTSL